MARSRTLKPSFFTSEQLAACAPLARLLFAGLWTIADRDGKLRDRPRKIKAEILPYEATPDCDAELADLADNGLIQRYEVDGERYLKVLGFKKHQNPHPKEPASEIPEPRPITAGPDFSATGREKDGAGPAVSCFPPPVSPIPQQLPPPAGGGRAGLPTKAERQAVRFPLAHRVLDLLADEFPETAPNDRDDVLAAFEAEAERRGGAAPFVDAIVAFMATRDVVPQTVAYFAKVIPNLPSAPDVTRASAPPPPESDPYAYPTDEQVNALAASLARSGP